VSVAAFYNATNVTVLMGLLSLMTIATAVVVSAVGEVVVGKIRAASRIRQLTDADQSRLQRIRMYYIGYSVAQILCATGQFAVTFFLPQINSNVSGPLWIWTGVAYPGLLFSLAFFFVILALKRKDSRLLRANEKDVSMGIVPAT
jgi:hypothetical protein